MKNWMWLSTKFSSDKNSFAFLAWSNMKLTRELEGRKRLDEINFQRAGAGPLVKTYKYDPTKPRPGKEEPLKVKKFA